MRQQMITKQHIEKIAYSFRSMLISICAFLRSLGLGHADSLNYAEQTEEPTGKNYVDRNYGWLDPYIFRRKLCINKL